MDAENTPAAVGSPVATASSQAPPTTAPGRAPLPSVADILAKKAAGTKLTRAEAGRLAWVNRPPRQTPGLAERGPSGGSPLEESPTAQSQQAQPLLPDLCRATAPNLLTLLEAGSKAMIAWRGRAVGAPPEAVKEFSAAADMDPAIKAALIETSPEWMEQLRQLIGVDPTNATGAAALIGFGLYGLGVGTAIAGLKPPPQTPEAPKP